MSSERVKLAVHGAAGKMGRRILNLAFADPDSFDVVAGLDRAGHPELGQSLRQLAGADNAADRDVKLTDSWGQHKPDVVIDFSSPEAAVALAKKCVASNVAIVVATTGFSKHQQEELISCHHDIPMVMSANYSLVVNALFKLVADAGKILAGKDFDVEIIERHHRHKVDAPSGTALRFAQILEQNMGLTKRVYGREGETGARNRSELGIHAIRTGDNVGEHTIVFSTMGETMELVHRGTSRDSYAKGALLAARFLLGKRPGMYSMNDVLGLS